jgi:hypothetical protein
VVYGATAGWDDGPRPYLRDSAGQDEKTATAESIGRTSISEPVDLGRVLVEVRLRLKERAKVEWPGSGGNIGGAGDEAGV